MMKGIRLFVDKCNQTGSIQLSIGDEHGGYRIAGSKYCGCSNLLEHELTERDIKEIDEYLRKAKANTKGD